MKKYRIFTKANDEYPDDEFFEHALFDGVGIGKGRKNIEAVSADDAVRIALDKINDHNFFELGLITSIKAIQADVDEATYSRDMNFYTYGFNKE